MSYKPAGFQDVIPNMKLKDAKEASSYYEAALGATGVELMTDDKGWVMHGHMKIGESVLFFGEETDWFPRKAPTEPGPVAFYIYVPDVDASYKRAVDAGMTSNSEPETMFWGDRTAVVTDKYHYSWTFSTQMEEVTPEEMDRRQKEWHASMAG